MRMLESLTLPAICSLLLLVVALGGCSGLREAAFERGVDLYLSGEYDDALKLLEASTKLMADNPDAYAWYAECLIAKGQYEKAAEAARKALELNPEHGFALGVLGKLFDPILNPWEKADSETAWFYLSEAIRLDPGDGNAWLAIIPIAQMRGDDQTEIRADTMLIALNFFTDVMLNYNRWVLTHLPLNAILVTGGDLDTYPCLALQVREGLRKDVAVLDLRLLGVDWYRSRINRLYSINLEATPPGIDTGNLDDRCFNSARSNWQMITDLIKMRDLGLLDRPLCLSRLLKESIPSEVLDRLVLRGGYYEVGVQEVSEQIHAEQASENVLPPNLDLVSGSLISDGDRSPERRAEAEKLRRDLGLP